MAFIDKQDSTVLNIKLTSKGRELLAEGKLNFKYFAIGDSEIDYGLNEEIQNDYYSSGYTGFDSSVLRAMDKNPNIISFITSSLSGDSYNEITSIPITNYAVENSIESIGFFTNSGTTFITDSNHVKQPDAMIQVSTVSSGFTLTLLKSPEYGASIEEPQAGDILFIRWTTDISTTGHSVNKTYPTPNLFYRIVSIVGTSKLSDGSITVNVDRQVPDFSGMGISNTVYAGAMIYYDYINYGNNGIIGMSPTEYVNESVIAFLENCQCPTIIFPFWNMSVLFTEEIAGVQVDNIKYTQFNNKSLGGFVSYIQNQAPVYKKLGVIHYTNNSPANVYAEGFLLKTPKLEIPTIMWHKSPTKTLGLTLVASGSSKILPGETKSLNVTYYDLCDVSGNIVGKVFPDLKIFIIEDQELLFAMSYKSNRSWTLPNYTIGV